MSLSRRPFVRRLGPPVLVLCVAALCGSPADAQDESPLQAVYFQASVTELIDGHAVVPMGDAHAIVPGFQFAVFRLRDGVFAPVGALAVEELGPAWCRCHQIAGDRSIAVNDIVLGMRTLAELSTPQAHELSFTRIQLTRNSRRNRYSTLDRRAAVEALIEYRHQHARWMRRQQADVSGILTSGTATGSETDSPTAIDRLYGHLRLLRQLTALHPQCLEATSRNWRDVFRIVGGADRAIDPEAVVIETGAPVGQFSPENIRAVVDDLFFDRPEQEQETLQVLLYAILRENPNNNEQWLRLRLSQTQFVDIASDEDLLVQMSVAIRRLRNAQS